MQTGDAQYFSTLLTVFCALLESVEKRRGWFWYVNKGHK